MTKTTYKQIDLAGWEKVGEGGNGSVYTCHEQPGVILKVSNYTAEDGATETAARQIANEIIHVFTFKRRPSCEDHAAGWICVY